MHSIKKSENDAHKHIAARMAIGAARDKQISEEAYKIKEIIPNENTPNNIVVD